MYLLITTILQFIYLFFCLITFMPRFQQTDIIKKKIFIFVSFFFFQLVSNSITSVQKKNCKTTFKNILSDSLLVALLSIIGYSFYIDLVSMKSTQHIFYPYLQTFHLSSFLISAVVVSFIFSARIFQILVLGMQKCQENNVDLIY